MMHRGECWGSRPPSLVTAIGSQVSHRQGLSQGVLISDDTKHRAVDIYDVFPFR